MPQKCSWTKDQLVLAVKDNISIAGAIRDLGLIPAGGNYSHIQRYINEYGLSTAHMKGQSWHKNSGTTTRKPIPLEEVLIVGSSYRTSWLKIRLLKEGYFEKICQSCGRTKWMGKPIPLELDHINGNNSDCRIENLAMYCPNCHALTPTYRRKKHKKLI